MLSRSNFCILFLILVFGLSLCLTNGFADNNSTIGFEDNSAIPEGSFDFPTAEGPEYIQGTPEFEKGLDSIFGTPDFEKVRDLPTDSRDYILGRKVGMIAVPQRYNPERSWICTGFLVGPDLFMTNHHCIHDEDGLLPLTDARIYMDYLLERVDDPTRGGVTAGVSDILRMDDIKDYALLRLDKPIGNTYGWLELDTATRANPLGESVKLISHNQGRSKEIVRRNSEVVAIPPDHPLARVPFPIVYLADTQGGSSGSPVFLREGTIVVGINHSAWFRFGVPNFNAGSLMSYIVPEIQQWLPGAPPPPPTPPPPPPGTVQMYWTDIGTRKIQRANLDGSNIEDLVTVGLTTPTGIAVDVSDGKMYWANLDPHKIQRANLDGSNIEDLVTIGLVEPEGIALDVGARKMYWSDMNRIRRANLDGTHVEDLVTQSIDTEDVALDIGARKMYWTDWGASKIQRANLDGTNVEDLVTGLIAPVNIELDIGARKMYWTGWGTSKIQRANLDGTNIEDVVTTGAQPNGLALDMDASQMYWIEQATRKIRRADLNGFNVEDLVVTGLQLPYGIVLGIPQTTPPGPTPPGPGSPVDVNGDGKVTVVDLAIVALFYGTRVPAGVSLPADVNSDGVVDLSDLTLVAQAIDAAGGGAYGFSLDDVEAALAAAAEQAAGVEDAAGAPMGLTTQQDILSGGIAYRNVAAAFADAKHLVGTDDVQLRNGTEIVLKGLLELLAEMGAVPETTALLPNYPNPFNPETWIPYHLATDADVSLTIYDTRGIAVRALTLGHQSAGIYESRARAAYWDGRNESGESVASGVYFYTLTAGDFTATRKLLIVK